MTEKIDRREFLKGSALAVAAAGTGCAMAGAQKGGPIQSCSQFPVPCSLIASAPVLQNAAETSIGVSFAVSADASGWVEYSTSPDLKNATRAYSGEHGLMTVDDKVALIRVTGLRPATKYYYHIGADRIEFKGGYAMKNLGSEVGPKIHSFTTLGAAATGSFCVINDTHDQKDTIDRVLAKVGALKPSVVLWNGDASNTSETIEDAMNIFIHTHRNHPEYAADTPYMFLNGNHDFRGRFNRRLGDLMMFRELGERKPEYAELGRNFVQRLGDVALIGLDTGEDKLDTNPKFAGIFKMKPYREKQAKWLAEVIESDAVRTAKFKVAFCHIPLYDPRPNANPGDVAPADAAPQYTHDFAIWQRTCANLWGPSLKKAGVQLVVAAHEHEFRYDAPTKDRPWAQIVGGGPELGVSRHWKADGTFTTTPAPERFPTVIEGKVEGGKLRIAVHDVLGGKVVWNAEYGAK